MWRGRILLVAAPPMFFAHCPLPPARCLLSVPHLLPSTARCPLPTVCRLPSATCCITLAQRVLLVSHSLAGCCVPLCGEAIVALPSPCPCYFGTIVPLPLSPCPCSCYHAPAPLLLPNLSIIVIVVAVTVDISLIFDVLVVAAIIITILL